MTTPLSILFTILNKKSWFSLAFTLISNHSTHKVPTTKSLRSNISCPAIFWSASFACNYKIFYELEYSCWQSYILILDVCVCINVSCWHSYIHTWCLCLHQCQLLTKLYSCLACWHNIRWKITLHPERNVIFHITHKSLHIIATFSQLGNYVITV